MSLLTAPIVKYSNTLAANYFIFLKKIPRLNLRGLQYQIWTLVNRLESSYQVKQILAFFAN